MILTTYAVLALFYTVMPPVPELHAAGAVSNAPSVAAGNRLPVDPMVTGVGSLTLPAVFSSHMVLQRDTIVRRGMPATLDGI